MVLVSLSLSLFIHISLCIKYIYLKSGPFHSPGCPGTQDVDQVGLELTEFKVPASASLMLALKKGMYH